MVSAIKNRIAVFEQLANSSKTSGNLLAIKPPDFPGFSIVKKTRNNIGAKETSRVVAWNGPKKDDRAKEKSRVVSGPVVSLKKVASSSAIVKHNQNESNRFEKLEDDLTYRKFSLNSPKVSSSNSTKAERNQDELNRSEKSEVDLTYREFSMQQKIAMKVKQQPVQVIEVESRDCKDDYEGVQDAPSISPLSFMETNTADVMNLDTGSANRATNGSFSPPIKEYLSDIKDIPNKAIEKKLHNKTSLEATVCHEKDDKASTVVDDEIEISSHRSLDKPVFSPLATEKENKIVQIESMEEMNKDTEIECNETPELVFSSTEKKSENEHVKVYPIGEIKDKEILCSQKPEVAFSSAMEKSEKKDIQGYPMKEMEMKDKKKTCNENPELSISSIGKESEKKIFEFAQREEIEGELFIGSEEPVSGFTHTDNENEKEHVEEVSTREGIEEDTKYIFKDDSDTDNKKYPYQQLQSSGNVINKESAQERMESLRINAFENYDAEQDSEIFSETTPVGVFIDDFPLDEEEDFETQLGSFPFSVIVDRMPNGQSTNILAGNESISLPIEERYCIPESNLINNIQTRKNNHAGISFESNNDVFMYDKYEAGDKYLSSESKSFDLVAQKWNLAMNKSQSQPPLSDQTPLKIDSTVFRSESTIRNVTVQSSITEISGDATPTRSKVHISRKKSTESQGLQKILDVTTETTTSEGLKQEGSYSQSEQLRRINSSRSQSDVSRPLSVTHSENTTGIDNRTKQRSTRSRFAKVIRSLSPFRRNQEFKSDSIDRGSESTAVNAKLPRMVTNDKKKVRAKVRSRSRSRQHKPPPMNCTPSQILRQQIDREERKLLL